MAGFRSISTAGRSLQRLLELRFRDERPVTDANGNPVVTSVAIVRTEDPESDTFANLVSRPALTRVKRLLLAGCSDTDAALMQQPTTAAAPELLARKVKELG